MRSLGTAIRALPAAVLDVLLALPAPGGALANGWAHAGIPYEALIAALGYDDPGLRKRAAHSLGHRGQAEAVPHLLTALAAPEPDHGVRSRIYLALGRLKAPSAAPVLLECLDRESREELRGDCVAALGGVRGDRARDRLIAVLGGDEHSLVKRRSVDALGRYGDGAAVAALAEIALGEGAASAPLRPPAVAALGATGRVDAAAPLLMLLDRAATERQALPIVRALGRTGAASARAPLTALLDRAKDARLRSALAVALATTGDRDTASTLAGLLADPSPMVQLAAILALERRFRRSGNAPPGTTARSSERRPGSRSPCSGPGSPDPLRPPARIRFVAMCMNPEFMHTRPRRPRGCPVSPNRFGKRPWQGAATREIRVGHAVFQAAMEGRM